MLAPRPSLDRRFPGASTSWPEQRGDAQLERELALTCQRLFGESSPWLTVGRFQLLRTLGCGGHGVVYAALDPRRREPVALKMLHSRGPSALYWLKREFRALADLVHPNLVALHELHVADDVAYFTMALVEGTDFLTFARTCDQSALIGALLQLCRGVYALHQAGKLHRDLKPHNVRVTLRGELVLLDFGLVADAARHDGVTAGTPVYVAPEQLAGEACESSDWYSLGVLLRATLQARRAAQRPSPAVLEPLVTQLTAVATASRPGYDQLVNELSTACRKMLPVPRAGPVARVPLLGRTAELGALQEAFERSKRFPAALLVRGASGTGKTALLREFVSEYLEPVGALVLSGRCYERESVPWRALDGLVDELSEYLRSLPTAVQEALLPCDCEALFGVFPVLGRLAQAHGPRVPRAVSPVNASAQLRHILRELARQRPLVFVIDDIQWSDCQSGRMLCDVLCHTESPPVLLLMTDRDDPGTAGPASLEFARAAEDAVRPLAIEELRLGPLAPSVATELAAALLPDGWAAQDVMRSIAAAGAGSPLIITELAQFVSQQVACNLPVHAPSIEAMFSERLQRIGADGTLVLRLLALAGRPVSGSVLVAAAGVDQHSLLFDRLRSERCIRIVLSGDADLLVLHHPQVGLRALQGLTPGARRALHARLAHAYREVEGPRAEALVDQYAAAGLPLMAADAARQAADRASAESAFARAAHLYARVIELGAARGAAASSLHESLACALEHAGCFDDAARSYQVAAALSGTTERWVLLEQRTVLLWMYQGKTAQALDLLRRCYVRLGLHWPKGRIGLLGSILCLSLPQALRSRLGRAPDVSPELRQARIALLGAVGAVLENHDLLRALHNTLVNVAECERLGDAGFRMRARAVRGLLRVVSLAPGGRRRGLRELERASAEAAAIDVETHAAALRLEAGAWLLTGYPERALDCARRCAEYLSTVPVAPLDAHEVTWLIGAALYQLGELRELALTWARFTHRARTRADVMTAFWIHVHPARIAVLIAAGDDAGVRALLAQQAELVEAHPGHRGLRFLQALCAVEYELGWGTAARALGVLREHRRTLRPALSPGLEGTARRLHARVALACAEQSTAPANRRHWLRVAHWHLGFLLRSRSPFERGLAHLLAAGRANLQGEPGRASSELERALPLLEQAGAKLAAASAAHVLGAFLPSAEAAAHKQSAAERLASEGVVDSKRWIAWTAPGFGDRL